MRTLVASLFFLCAGCCARSSAPPPPAGTSAPVASVAPMPALPPTETRAFHVIATSPEPFALHPVEGATFVHAGGFFAALSGEEIHQDPKLLLGLANYGEVARLDGEWPGAAYLTLLVTPKLTPWTTLRKVYRWYESHWSAAANPLHETPPAGIAAWGDRSLALLRDDGKTLRFHLARAMADAPVPVVPTSSEEGCPQVLRARSVSLLGWKSGDLVLLGEACGKSNGGAPAVVRWAKGALEGTLALLPKGEGGEVIAPLIAAGSSADIHVGGRSGDAAYLARFDGAAWSIEPVPSIGPLVAVSVAPDGAVWIASRTSVQRKPAGGAFSPVARADGTPLDGVSTLVARSVDRAFLTVDAPAGSELLSTDKSSSVLALADKKTFWEARAATGRQLATTACRDLFAQMSIVGKHNGYIPNDMPFLRETMRDHPELAAARFVLDDDGQELALGAIVPSIEVGEKLLTLFAPRLGLASTKVSCHIPTVIAEVRSR